MKVTVKTYRWERTDYATGKRIDTGSYKATFLAALLPSNGNLKIVVLRAGKAVVEDADDVTFHEEAR